MKKPQKGEVVRCFLGIDAGSTTTKFVLLDEQEEILDSFYAPNEGSAESSERGLDLFKKTI